MGKASKSHCFYWKSSPDKSWVWGKIEGVPRILELFLWLLQFLGFGRFFSPGKSGKSSWKKQRELLGWSSSKGRRKFSKISPKSRILLRFWGLSLRKAKFGNKSRGILAFWSLIPERTVLKRGNLGRKIGKKWDLSRNYSQGSQSRFSHG